MREIKGLVTGIGSLPHKDAEPALDLIFKYCPQAPFWPQLPKRDTKEGMVAQFTQNLPVGGSDDEKKLEEFYEKIINKDVEYFGITEDYASGLYAFKKRLKAQPGLLEEIEFIKGHITGPFTFAASLKDEAGAAYLHKSIYMQAFIEGLARKALWQVSFFQEFSKKMIIFLDEPYLGCFGSAYTPINREDVIRGLSTITAAIKSEDILTGVHCCGNTDWSIFTDIKSLDIINFDAFGFLDKFALYADNLKSFMERGGIICWGIVPTDGNLMLEPGLLLDKLYSGIASLVKKGLNKDLLIKNLLISPACGLGALNIGASENIFETLSEVSTRIKALPRKL